MIEDVPPELATLLHSCDPVAREQAWGALVLRYQGLLLHAARALGGDRDAVMDRYAFVLEHLRYDGFRRLRSYDANRRTRFSTWLTVVASRLCLDEHRRRYGRFRPGGDDEAEVEARRERRKTLAQLLSDSSDPDEIVDTAAPDPEGALLERERHEALESVIATLAPEDRLLVRLRFQDGWSVPRIAAAMGFPSPFHAYRRLDRVLADLRQRLEQRGFEGSVPDARPGSESVSPE